MRKRITSIFGFVFTLAGLFAGTGLAADTMWVDDAIPAGATTGADGGDSWNWVTSPAPFSGTKAHQSSISTGAHQHYFDWVYSGSLPVGNGEVLFAYVYLDPANVPSEIMLQWNDGTWEHRAFWGQNLMNYGTGNSASSRYMGALPAAGQWVRLEVPASQVALEGSTIKGMSFSLYDGRATWDAAGKASSASTTPSSTSTDTSTNTTSTNTTSVVDTNATSVVTTTDTNSPAVTTVGTNALLPGTSSVDNLLLQMPKVGDYALHVLTPTLLELKLINTQDKGASTVSTWNLVDSALTFVAPALNQFSVTANGQTVGVSAVGFKRRPLYAPLVNYDLRIDNSLYIQLSAPLSDNQTIVVKNPNGSLWSTNANYTATVDPLRYSPAIHVNQEGYMPNYSKKAMVGYYAGSMGELNVISSSGFKLVDATTGATAFSGSLVQRSDVGYVYTPTPYQKVYEADFTGFNTPGEYKLVVPGMGASLPFRITDGIAMDFARTYMLGLYHQRCGMDNSLPYTRFTHDACHTAAAAVPATYSAFPYTWNTISNYSQILNADNPVQTAPKLTGPAAQLFPFVKTGTIDVSGGHHDAGDYSKYTLNSVALIHYLTFAVDSFQGVAALDNLGIPESGDGISDVLQEAKWEADFLAKMQDSDGGFYFLVYPQQREYEGNVTPDHGDPQLVWPKTSTATASSVAALAEIASSPAFKQAYPQVAAMYLQKAQLGWQFLTNAIAKYGKNGIYQKITHYGDDFGDRDELAWAAAAMYVATGDVQYQNALFQWFPDPTDPATFRWGWWRLFLSYGNAVRDYAFAVRSGRLTASQVNSTYLAKCESVITAAGDDLVKWSGQNAYGTSFPEETKHVQGAGWYFSGDQTFDLATAYQVSAKSNYINAILANMNYEGGCNPVNVSYVTGMGWKRERDAVSQYAANDRRVMPPTGEPIGNIQWGFSYLDNYGSTLNALCFPSDNAATAPTPFYDRWADSWNVSTEFVTFQTARGLAAYAFVAAQTSLKSQAWKAVPGQINIPDNAGTMNFTLSAPGVDLSQARIVWETRDGDPYLGQSFNFTPKDSGSQWIEAEAQLPDGRRIFAATNFTARIANVVWVDDALPTGAAPGGDGDSWTWTSSNPSPASGNLTHPSASASGMHQHYFSGAWSTMKVGTNTVLYSYIYLDPANPPSELMLQWNDGSSWEHRAYWGANNLSYGNDSTASRYKVGALPATGQWVQLQVPANQVGLEGKIVSGMAFTLYGGKATWDAAGVLDPSVTNSTGSSTNSSGSSTNNTTGSTNATLPTVSVTARDGSAASSTPGVFTFTRSGDTSNALTVTYTLGGTASSGVDYIVPAASPAVGAIIAVPSVTIPAGATSATLSIMPTTSTNIVDAKTVIATVGANANYTVASPGNATATIAGNTVSKPSLQMNAAGPTLSWASTDGAAYRIAFKNDLSDTTWTYLPNTISSTSVMTSWTDTDKKPQRFYLIIRVQ
jgi:hypothetical protein